MCLLVALLWRYRDRPLSAGSSLGLACGVKFFLWPLGVWLLASGRGRAAGLAAAVAIGSVLLVAPFAPFDEYVHTLREVGREFDRRLRLPRAGAAPAHGRAVCRFRLGRHRAVCRFRLGRHR